MAKKQLPAVDQSPTQLTFTKEEFDEFLDSRIVSGEEIFKKTVRTQEEFESNKQEFSDWCDYISEYLKRAFNKEFNEYKRSFDDAGIPYFYAIRPKSPAQLLEEFKAKVKAKVDNLKKLRAKSELLISQAEVSTPIIPKTNNIILNTTQVFIVHGHDDAAKTKTARFIEKIGFTPIILHEQASSGKTVIEKIEEYSNVGFGIVLYTPCDIGGKKEANPTYRNRARQNVVFEHGYLIGKIGRKNVCALVKEEIETPNDISGVVYIKMDEEDAWHFKLAKELRNSGYSIDMNKLA